MAVPKITTGGAYKRALRYDFDGRPGEPRTPRGEWIAGSCVGASAEEIGAQFKPILALRSEAKNPIWRCSINLHPSDGRLFAADWHIVGRRFLVLMGIDPDKAAWCAVNHRDRPHDHLHLTLSRVLPDGSLWDRANDVKRAIKACAQIERESIALLGRQLHVHERGTQKERRELSRGEVEIENREGRVMSRKYIQLQVDQILKAHPDGIDLFEFVGKLRKVGVEATPYLPKGKFAGMSYTAQGISWPGAKLGTAYTNTGLIQRGVFFQAEAFLESTNLLESSDVLDLVLYEGEVETPSPDKWWLRQKADFVRSRFGPESAEHMAVLAELLEAGFGPEDEIRYQICLENDPSIAFNADGTIEDYIREMESEFGIPPAPDITS